MKNDLQPNSLLYHFASDFKTDFTWGMAIAQVFFFFFLLNKCKILLLENKTFPLSSKETRCKNNDKILSQFTNRLGMYQLFSKTTRRAWKAVKLRGLLRENSNSSQNTPCHFDSVHFREITRRTKVK